MTEQSGAVHVIDVTVNGVEQRQAVTARQLLVHFIRETLGLRGTHIGCDSGNCGACSVICDGELIKSCMMLAVQADGREIETIEGLGDGPDGTRSDPGGLPRRARPAVRLLHAGDRPERRRPCSRRTPTRATDEIRRALKGNICRCTGYVNIVRAIEAAAAAQEGASR